MSQKNFFFNCVQWGKESWNVFDYIVFPIEHFKKNGGQFFTVYLWISWPDHMPFAAFQWKNDKCPCRRWAHLTWDLMECEKITVSYLSLNKHIYEMHTSLNCPLWFYGFLWDYKSGRFQCWMDLAIWGGGGGIHKILKGWPGHLQGLWYWEFF